MDEWNGMGKLAQKWPISPCSNADVALMVWSYLNFICGIVRAKIGLESHRVWFWKRFPSTPELHGNVGYFGYP